MRELEIPSWENVTWAESDDDGEYHLSAYDLNGERRYRAVHAQNLSDAVQIFVEHIGPLEDLRVESLEF